MDTQGTAIRPANSGDEWRASVHTKKNVFWVCGVLFGVLAAGTQARAASQDLSPWRAALFASGSSEVCSAMDIEPGSGNLQIRIRPELQNTSTDLLHEGLRVIQSPTLGVSAVQFFDPWGGDGAVQPFSRHVEIIRDFGTGAFCIVGPDAYICGPGFTGPARIQAVATGPGWRVDLRSTCNYQGLESLSTRRMSRLLYVTIPWLLWLVFRRFRVRRELLHALMLGGALGALFGCVEWISPRTFSVVAPSVMVLVALLLFVITLVAGLDAVRGRPGGPTRLVLLLAAWAGLIWFALWPRAVSSNYTFDGLVSSQNAFSRNWLGSSSLLHPFVADNMLAVRSNTNDRNWTPVEEIYAKKNMWLVLGSSVVYGRDVSPAETFVAQMEAILSAHGHNATFVNLGVEGATLAQSIALLERSLNLWSIEGIIIVSKHNDAVFPLGMHSPDVCQISLPILSLCNWYFSPLNGTAIKVGVIAPLRMLFSDVSLEYARQLESFLQRQIALDRKIVVLDELAHNAGEVRNDMVSQQFGAIQRVQMALAHQYSIKFASFEKDFLSAERDQLFLGFGHLTAKGHRKFAQLAAPVIELYLSPVSVSVSAKESEPVDAP